MSGPSGGSQSGICPQRHSPALPKPAQRRAREAPANPQRPWQAAAGSAFSVAVAAAATLAAVPVRGARAVVPVLECQLLAGLCVPRRQDGHAVAALDQHHLRAAVGLRAAPPGSLSARSTLFYARGRADGWPY